VFSAGTVNWKIFKLKKFHEIKFRVKKKIIVAGGLGKFLKHWQKGNII